MCINMATQDNYSEIRRENEVYKIEHLPLSTSVQTSSRLLLPFCYMYSSIFCLLTRMASSQEAKARTRFIFS